MNDDECKKLLFEISMHKSTIEKMKKERFKERFVTWMMLRELQAVRQRMIEQRKGG